MLFSWNQLTDYLRLTVPHEELAERLSLVGFNHESTREVGGDLAIDLEITSNRPDCLNHLGIAREIGLLLGQPVRYPAPPTPRINAKAPPALAVANQAPDLCPRYEAITIHGTKVGPSPWWLVKRLETLGFRSINNVVDVTNYVMSETGQPIHAYDLAKLDGRTLVVRRAAKGEAIEALDHKRYELDEAMLVIADASRPACIAGVMGSSTSEVDADTNDLAIEVARFDPLNVRRTSRALGLQTQSSYRNERPIDPRMILGARDRCVELILATGGGTVRTAASAPATVPDAEPTRVTLRVDRVARLLGIEVPRAEIERILSALGLTVVESTPEALTYEVPAWRSDLTREVDLIEEVGRIHDYAHIPEDRPVRIGGIRQDRRGRVEAEARALLTNRGHDEAITYSFVPRELVGAEFAPDPTIEPIRVEHATRKQANLMRLSLVPSLLEAASYNEAHGNLGVRLFEVGNVYRPVEGRDLPDETTRLAIVAPGDFFAIKGLLEGLASRLRVRAPLAWAPRRYPTFRPGRAAEIRLGADLLGFAGELAPATLARLKLREAYSALEVSIDLLDAAAEMIPQHVATPPYPGAQRDLSLIVPAKTPWATVASTVADAADPATFEGITFGDTFRGGNLPPDQQSVHFTVRFRNPTRTMTSDEIDAGLGRIVDRCRAALGATLRT